MVHSLALEGRDLHHVLQLIPKGDTIELYNDLMGLCRVCLLRFKDLIFKAL